MKNSTTLRFIRSPAAPGAWNMAVDEAVLEALEQDHSPPTLRLYRWQPAALSLGFSQPFDDCDPSALARNGWDVVRRPTGGRAILHTDELTYAIVLPLSHPLAAGGVLPSYQKLSRGLRHGLRELGLDVEVKSQKAAQTIDLSNPVCFEVPSAYELTVQGKKLIGSAQVRRKKSLLQHGSLPLEGDLGRICDVLHFESETEQEHARTRLRARAGTLETLTGRTISWQQASEALVRGFSLAFEMQFEPGSLTPTEQEHAEKLMVNRYQQGAWTQRI
ncbi:MAG: biotin/lipoate A/B protein ligase family protein [Anaerolineales bacterium]